MMLACYPILEYVKSQRFMQTVCSAINSNNTNKQMLPEVRKFFPLYLTVSLTTYTSERSFSALKCPLTYLQAMMTKKRLNNCLLVHAQHQEIRDNLDLVQVTQNFVNANDEDKNI